MRRVNCRTLRCLCLTLIVITILYFLYRCQEAFGRKCTRETSVEVLDNLCALYAVSKVDGSLCQELCNEKSLVYQSCFNRIGGKIVIQVRWNNRQAILKSRNAALTQYEPVYQGVLDNDDDGGVHHIMTWKTFGGLIHSHVRATLGIRIDVGNEELLLRLSMRSHNVSNNVMDTDDDEQSGIRMNSLWSLLQQEEYLFLRYFNRTTFLPKLYGTCGHFYAVEFVPSGVMYPSTLQTLSDRFTSARWDLRARAASSLLDIVRATDTDFEQPLHLCDVKPENFGIVDDQVKAVDIDISFFDGIMGNMLEQPSCSSDEDCDFFDCHGVCDMQAAKCTRQRKNNNFQSVCSDIFQRKPGNSGLLRHPPPTVEHRLSELLQKCIYPDPDENIARGSMTETFSKLQDLLNSS